MLMQKTYNKGQGDTSVRIETDYKLNEAGAKQYVIDRIKELDAFNKDNFLLFEMKYNRVVGASDSFFALGLIDIFNYEELTLKILSAYKRYCDRICSPVEQI